jgi:Na+-driven multidrug efflux pump
VLRQILRIGVPATANWLAMSLVMLWHLAIVGRLGDTALAALVGQALGARRPDLARGYGWMAFRWGCCS